MFCVYADVYLKFWSRRSKRLKWCMCACGYTQSRVKFKLKKSYCNIVHICFHLKWMNDWMGPIVLKDNKTTTAKKKEWKVYKHLCLLLICSMFLLNWWNRKCVFQHKIGIYQCCLVYCVSVYCIFLHFGFCCQFTRFDNLIFRSVIVSRVCLVSEIWHRECTIQYANAAKEIFK